MAAEHLDWYLSRLQLWLGDMARDGQSFASGRIPKPRTNEREASNKATAVLTDGGIISKRERPYILSCNGSMIWDPDASETS